MMHRRSFLLLGIAGLLTAGITGAEAKTNPVPRVVVFGLVKNLDLQAGTFAIHRPRGPQSKHDVSVTVSQSTTYINSKRKSTDSSALAEGELVQVAGFRNADGTVSATQVAIITTPGGSTTGGGL